MYSSKLRLCLRNIRNLSTITSNRTSQATTLANQDLNHDFTIVFPDLVRDLTESEQYKDIPEVTSWYSKVLEYNVPKGRKMNGLTVVYLYQLLEKPENLTPENIRLANIMGWCAEMHRTFMLVGDDIIDGAQLRRGIPCWHRVKGVGISAINDGVLIENSIFAILKKHFKNHPFYVPAFELFHDITLKSCFGEILDVQSNTKGRPNFESFTMDRFNTICKYKTMYCAIQLPIGLAMCLAGKYNTELLRQAETISSKLGHLYQSQNDFLDCFGKPELVGKDGTDIRNGTCTWLIVKALERANPAQREVIQRCYGKADKESEEIIRNIYEELELPKTYHAHEEKYYNLIQKQIQEIDNELLHKLFFYFLEKNFIKEN